MEISTVCVLFGIYGRRLHDSVVLLYNDAERGLAEDCVHRMVKRAVDMEGTVTVSAVLPSYISGS